MSPLEQGFLPPGASGVGPRRRLAPVVVGNVTISHSPAGREPLVTRASDDTRSRTRASTAVGVTGPAVRYYFGNSMKVSDALSFGFCGTCRQAMEDCRHSISVPNFDRRPF